MNKDQREILRKLRILRYADEIGSVVRACRYFGVGRSSFYRWRQAYAERGEAGLINAPINGWPSPNGMPIERHLNAKKRCCTFVANTISGRCGSFGILSATTT